MVMSPAAYSQYSKGGSNPNVPQLWSADKLHAVCLYKSMAKKGWCPDPCYSKAETWTGSAEEAGDKGHLLCDAIIWNAQKG